MAALAMRSLTWSRWRKMSTAVTTWARRMRSRRVKYCGSETHQEINDACLRMKSQTESLACNLIRSGLDYKQLAPVCDLRFYDTLVNK